MLSRHSVRCGDRVVPHEIHFSSARHPLHNVCSLISNLKTSPYVVSPFLCDTPHDGVWAIDACAVHHAACLSSRLSDATLRLVFHCDVHLLFAQVFVRHVRALNVFSLIEMLTQCTIHLGDVHGYVVALVCARHDSAHRDFARASALMMLAVERALVAPMQEAQTLQAQRR